MVTPSSRPRSPPALMEDHVEEILLRIPPDEPAHLFLAALVCKPWRRILSDPGFLRRYRALHRAPLLLGYFHNLHHNGSDRTEDDSLPFPQFVSTVTAYPFTTPPLTLDSTRLDWLPRVEDCRHGRVLIEVTGGLIVWDPVTGDQKELSVPKYPHNHVTGTVLCAVDGSCDHLDCHASAFLVISCGEDLSDYPYKVWVTMYSSETGVWSSMIYNDVGRWSVYPRPALIIENDVYFFSVQSGATLLKYDIRRHELSSIDSPGVWGSVAMELDDGELGFVAVLDNCIYMWSWQAHANNGFGRWEQHKVMELEALLPRSVKKEPEAIGLVEGTYTIFIGHEAGVFTLDIKSRKVKKVGKSEAYDLILPYVSFYTPRSS